MEKPAKPHQPWPPAEYQFKQSKENAYIYKFSESLQEEEDYDDDEEKEVPEKDIEDVTLAWLLSKVPEGVDPSQVKLEFGYNAGAFAYEDHFINFYHERTIPARPKEYKEALWQHELKMAKYWSDLAEYEENLRLYEIHEAEQKIQEAKEKLKKLIPSQA